MQVSRERNGAGGEVSSAMATAVKRLHVAPKTYQKPRTSSRPARRLGARPRCSTIYISIGFDTGCIAASSSALATPPLDAMEPTEKGRWHRHHILEKLGYSNKYRDTLLDAQEILWTKYEINPFTSLEMFVWARLGRKGMHGKKPALNVANQIIELADRNASKKEMTLLLKRLGEEFADL